MIRSTIQRLLSDSSMLYECRSCGTKIESEREVCPTCGSGEIAHYDLP